MPQAVNTRLARPRLPYGIDDLSAVLESWHQASLIAHPFLSEEFLAAERVRLAEQWLPAAESAVAVVDGHVVGFLSLVGNEVGGLFVHPDHQGHGHGRDLMDDARAKRPHLELEVFEANPIGRGFYAAYGFGEIGKGADEETGLPVLRLRLG